jgi:cysteinyl-tRNA synthetase
VTHLKVNGEKMSKSKGNDYRLAQVIEMGYSTPAVRHLYLSAHYRKELNFSFDGLAASQTAVQRLVDFRRRLDETMAAESAGPSKLADIASKALIDFEVALDDDLNTPNALAVVYPFMNEVHAELDRVPSPRPADLDAASTAIDRMDDVLGLIELARRDAAAIPQDFAARVDGLVRDRESARGRRDFAAADAIRQELAGLGVVVEDTPSGPRWKKKA